MNTCKTCKHWGSSSEWRDSIRFYSCESPDVHYGYGVNDEDVPDSGIIVEYDEGWGMQTGCDFGCVLHEVKE